MKITKLKLATLIGLLASSLSVNATIIDNGSYTTDTITGLDWLDVTMTLNMSVNEVSNDTRFIGWRYATTNDLNNLVTDYIGFDITTYFDNVLSSYYNYSSGTEFYN